MQICTSPQTDNHASTPTTRVMLMFEYNSRFYNLQAYPTGNSQQKLLALERVGSNADQSKVQLCIQKWKLPISAYIQRGTLQVLPTVIWGRHCHTWWKRMDSPTGCATICAMPTADKSNHSATGTLHPHLTDGHMMTAYTMLNFPADKPKAIGRLKPLNCINSYKLYIAKPCKNHATGNTIIAMATLTSRQANFS